MKRTSKRIKKLVSRVKTYTGSNRDYTDTSKVHDYRMIGKRNHPLRVKLAASIRNKRELYRKQYPKSKGGLNSLKIGHLISRH